MAGEHLDITSEPDDHSTEADRRADASGAPRAATGRRPFLGVHFTCCDVYVRVYVNRSRTAYEGRCPRCSRRAVIEIAPGGSDSRFFQAG